MEIIIQGEGNKIENVSIDYSGLKKIRRVWKEDNACN